MTRRLVLVTGTPRSGTTPIGDALATAPGARSLYEPLNFHVGDRRVGRYFEVVGAAGFTSVVLDDLVRGIRLPKLRLRPGVFPEDIGLRRLGKRLTGSRTTMTYRQARLDPRLRTIVWKDPFATFLVEDLVEDHDLPVIATVRPPHAVAASFKRLGWAFDVPDLIERLAGRGRDHRDLLSLVDTTTPAGNAAVLWHVANLTLVEAADRHSEVLLVNLEDFVEDRRGVMRRLYAHAGLQWSPRVDAHLARSAAGEGAAPTRARAHVGPRDPSAVNRYWVDVLDDEEVTLVDAINADLWRRIRSRP